MTDVHVASIFSFMSSSKLGRFFTWILIPEVYTPVATWMHEVQ